MEIVAESLHASSDVVISHNNKERFTIKQEINEVLSTCHRLSDDTESNVTFIGAIS